MTDVWFDVRYAVRTLGRRPGFAAAAVLTITIGLTGAVAMFALVDGVLLSPLPVRAEEELLVGWRGLPEPGSRRWPFTTADLDLLRREARVLSGVAGVGYNDPAPMPLADGGDPAPVRVARVTGTFFRVLGAEPLIGRGLQPDDDRSGAENVLVLSRALWRARFGGRTDILGRRVTLAGQPFTIVGVMPGDVDHPRHVQAWATVAAVQTTNRQFADALASELDMLARMQPGVTALQARDALAAFGPALDMLRPATDRVGYVPQVMTYREFVVGDVRAPLAVLFGAVALVLLIACANVSSLLLMRGEARRGEFAVRAALGAGRRRLLRHLVAEALVLAGAGAALALAATGLLMPRLLVLVPEGLPRVDAVRMEARVVLFAAAAAGLTAVLAAGAPVVSSWRHRLVALVRELPRGGGEGGRPRWRSGMVVVQVALSVVGLVGIGLLAGSFQRLREEARRLASDELVLVPLNKPEAKYADPARWREFVTALGEAVDADPRVTRATPVNATPFSGSGWDVLVFTVEGQSDDRAERNIPLNLEEIHPGYFETFEVAIVRGRTFTTADREDTTPVAIVSADVAARAWPGLDPIGRRLKWGRLASTGPWLTVVGVAAPTRYRTLQTPTATIYVPAVQMLGTARQIAIRTAMPSAQVAALVRARAGELDPAVQVLPLRPFAELLEVPLARPRFYSVLMTGFGVTGLALAAVGLYGVLAAGVRQRRREIGIRLALGAEVRHMRRLVLADGAGLVAAGIGLGLAASAVATRAMRGLLYGVEPLDPVAFAGAVAGILVVSAAALVVPLRSASRIAPADVLRAE